MHKIKLIEAVKVTDVYSRESDFRVNVLYSNPDSYLEIGCYTDVIKENVEEKIIKSRRYSRMTKSGDIETKLLGFDDEVCRILEILSNDEYGELEHLRDQYYSMRRKYMDKESLLTSMYDKMDKLENASFWKRLCWLFTGVVVSDE
jgi:hypothetical protein